jgi:type IV pilus assembly protein PilC
VVTKGEEKMAPSYAYRARDRAGRLVEGLMEADSNQLVLNQLREQNLLVLKVEEKKKLFPELAGFSLMSQKVKTKDLAVFSRQFATMISAGVPLLRCLNILQQQGGSKKLQHALAEVSRDLERGMTLSEAMGKQPNVFPVMYINMVEAGEVGGVLEEVLERMANHFEREDEIREKVKSALTYPGMILGIAVLAVIFMLTFVLPTFAELLLSLEVELPAITKFIMNLSNSMITYWYLYLAFATAMIAGASYILKTPQGRYFWDYYSLKLPIYGKMQCKVIVSRFSRTLATLLRSGVPIIASLEVVKKTSNNMVMANSVELAKENIREGQSIAEPLKVSGILPPMAIQMISIGEETGELDSMLEKISFFYDREIESTIARLSTTLEPILLVGIGIIIGGMVLSFMLPMVQIYNSI